MHYVISILIALALVALAIVVIIWGRPGSTGTPTPDDQSFDPENEVYTTLSALPDLCRENGTGSLEGLKKIFLFELHKQLFVFDDTVAQRLQIYDVGGGMAPRWTVLLPFERDPQGDRYHPFIQFDETLEGNGWTSGKVYPIDYRTMYGRKVPFRNLPWDVQLFILSAIQAPIVENFELERE